jgi:hypothetical protein
MLYLYAVKTEVLDLSVLHITLNPSWQTECVVLWFYADILRLRFFVPTRDITQKIEVVKYNYFEKSCLLGYNIVYFNESQPPFRRNMTPPFSKSKSMWRKKTTWRGSKQRRASRWFLASFAIRPWRRSRHISPNHLSTLIELFSVMFQKKILFITTAMITSNPIHLLWSRFVFLSIVWVRIEKLIFSQMDNFAAFYSAQEVHYCGRNHLPHVTPFYFRP